MTQNDKGGYGLQWPRWYVYWRGRWWLRSGFCPNCYSSPPNDKCFVCEGDHNYGYRQSYGDRGRWVVRWDIFKDRPREERRKRRSLRRMHKHERKINRG